MMRSSVRVAGVTEVLSSLRSQIMGQAWIYILLTVFIPFFYVVNFVMSLVTRKIRWRTITYELISPTQTRHSCELKPELFLFGNIRRNPSNPKYPESAHTSEGGIEALRHVLWKSFKRLNVALRKVTVYRGKFARFMQFLPLYAQRLKVLRGNKYRYLSKL